MPARLSDPAAKQKKIRFLILGGGLVLLVAFSYGSGMRGQKRVTESVKQERRVLRERLRLAELSLRGRDTALVQWEARRLVAMALHSLDRANFGDAREQIDSAVRHLEAAAGVGSANSADLADAISQLKTLEIVPSENRGAIRDRLTAIAQAMDKALSAVAPDPSSITAVTVPAPNLNDIPKLPGPEIGR